GEKGTSTFPSLRLVPVRGRAHPFRDVSVAVPDRLGTTQMPAERPVEAPQASLEVQRIATAHRVLPGGARLRFILRMRRRTAQERRLQGGERGAEILDPAAVQIIELAVRTANPDQMRQRIGEQSEIRSARAAF